MQYGIAHLAVIPMRSEGNDSSEMINHVLFGEHFKITDKRKKWSKIKLAHDKYCGWICNKQFLEISKNIYDKLELDNPVLTTDFIDIIYNEKSQPILIGSTLPSFDKKIFKLGEKEIKFQGLTTKGLKNKNLLIEYAMLYLNAPYLWGGRSPFGIDCSGLTQMTYRLQGTEIPRDAQQQAELGKTLSFIEESQPGDLAFFDNSEGKIIHVGLILENNYIIHASGKVRIDRLDQQGIYNNEIRSHTHKLRLIKSII